MLKNTLILSSRIKYSISTNISGGSASISPQGKQYSGTLITINCSANPSYQFNSISIIKEDGSTVDYSTITAGLVYTFIMPSSNVIINIRYSLIPTYSLSLRAIGGSIQASKTNGIRQNEVITLTLTPNAYYNNVSLTASPNVNFSGTGTTRTFIMPASNVTITATFTSSYAYKLTVGRFESAGVNLIYGYGLSGSYTPYGSLNPNSISGYEIARIDSIFSYINKTYTLEIQLVNQMTPWSSIRLLFDNKKFVLPKQNWGNMLFYYELSVSYNIFEAYNGRTIDIMLIPE